MNGQIFAPPCILHAFRSAPTIDDVLAVERVLRAKYNAEYLFVGEDRASHPGLVIAIFDNNDAWRRQHGETV